MELSLAIQVPRGKQPDLVLKQAPPAAGPSSIYTEMPVPRQRSAAHYNTTAWPIPPGQFPLVRPLPHPVIPSSQTMSRTCHSVLTVAISTGSRPVPEGCTSRCTRCRLNPVGSAHRRGNKPAGSQSVRCTRCLLHPAGSAHRRGQQAGRQPISQMH